MNREMATDIMATSHTKLTRPILLTRFIRFALAPLKMRLASLRSAQCAVLHHAGGLQQLQARLRRVFESEQQVSERSERALMKTRILAMNPANTKLTHSIYFACSVLRSVLFRMQANHEKYEHFPLRAMFVLMEKFTETSPMIDRSVLEEFMPYTILHAAYVDMSLNKQFETDSLLDSKLAFENAAQ